METFMVVFTVILMIITLILVGAFTTMLVMLAWDMFKDLRG